jgi:hypothetical protein
VCWMRRAWHTLQPRQSHTVNPVDPVCSGGVPALAV